MMGKNAKSIPVNTWSVVFAEGVVISRASHENKSDFEDLGQSHRDDWHVFILQEKGSTFIEIDFQKYELKPSSMIYIHPNQVHRLLAFENATISTWAINNENLKPEYLKVLEDITPVKVLPLNQETFSILSETVSLGIRYAERKYEILYNALLKDNCNTLVALAASQYLTQTQSTHKLSRFETIAKIFKTELEHHFASIKHPKDYAKALNISTPYLNECVRNATGYSVSSHIQQRIVLEAKRLLYHSNSSIKEIASELGYDDYSYFTRLFAKITKMTPAAFRNKNFE